MATVMRFQFRRGTAAEWTSADPVLADGEPGVEKDTGKQKIGDGVRTWNALPYTATKGDPGPAGVADDNSVKTLITTPGSQTAAALSATFEPKGAAAAAAAPKLDKTEAAATYSTPSTVATQVPPIVTAALASDPTPANAAAAAVTAAIAGRPIQEGGAVLEDTISFAVVDEDGRRTWIEAGTDGKPTQRATDLIAEKAGPAISATLGVQDMNQDITSLAFAVVDEDGRRTWLETDASGKPSARTIGILNSLLSYPPIPVVADPTKIVIPAALPMYVGQTYKLYYADFIDALDKNHTVVASSSANGVDYGDRWVFTPTAAGTFNLVLTVMDRIGAVVQAKTVPITVYAAVSGATKRHMAIGDSITRAGDYAGIAATAIGAATVGIRTYNNGVLNVEGRGGWTLNQYMNQIGHATWGDSPFLFPIGVAGAKYWGNTSFWKSVCYADPNGYDYQGFQYIARGWKPSGNPYLFDANGYPTAPVEGDVVVDPTKATGQTFLQYTSGAWVTMSTQPTIEFNFSKYMERYAAAYPAGGPTSISIMLETNDFYNGIDDASFATWKARLDTVIASVRAWSATVPFIVLLAATGGPPQNWAAQGAYNKFGFDRRMRDAGNRILAAYDTSANRTNKVYVTTFLGAITAANMTDHVHPAVTAGHAEMSPYLAGMLAKLTSEGA